MNLQHCEKEALVIKAAQRGYWEEDLRAHAAECSVCSDAALAAQFLQEMQHDGLAEVRLPSAGWMWWRAQLMAKRDAAERATQPITLVEQMAGAYAALSIIGVLIWQWHAIRAWVASFGGTWHMAVYPAHAMATSVVQESSKLLILSAGGFLVILGFAAYLIWAKE
jgi:hypothetical protein